MKFLTARWEDLLLANYAVDPAVLEPYVPKGTKIDLYEGVCYVSLVAFMFRKTRVLGIPVPFHLNFEEVNLRYYICPENEPTQRAVGFIKEIVPSRVIPWISNTLFKEHYESMPMAHQINRPDIAFQWGKNLENQIAAKLETDPAIPPTGSLNEFITEHYHGYTFHPGGTLHYQVHHPQWQVAEITDFTINTDFATTYGPDFAFLNTTTPTNVCYAAGSDVSVSFPSRLIRNSG